MATTVLNIQETVLQIVPVADWPRTEHGYLDLPTAGQMPVLLGRNGVASIYLTTLYGPLELSIDILDEPPAAAEPGAWEKIQEVELTSTQPLIVGAGGSEQGLPLTTKAGTWRVRVHLRGTEGDEQCWLQAWPASG